MIEGNKNAEELSKLYFSHHESILKTYSEAFEYIEKNMKNPAKQKILEYLTSFKKISDAKNKIFSDLKKEYEEAEKLNKLLNQIKLDSDQIIREMKSNDFYIPKEDNDDIFYDAIVDVSGLKEIKTGWPIIFKNEQAKKRYEEKKSEECCVVGVIGNFNKGKSHILSAITNFKIASGYSVQTKGISVKYHQEKNTAVTILDTAGYETPLKFVDYLIKDGEKNEEIIISELARDRQHIEVFMQNFIIEKSNILMVVVGSLSFSDQKLLNRIYNMSKNKKLFVIHNLKDFIYNEQVEKYLEETLYKTFLLKKIEFTVFEYNESQNKYYWIEKDRDINHIVICKENSEAGKYFNFSSYKFLKTQMEAFTNKVSFDPLVAIKNQLCEKSRELMEEDSILTSDMISINDQKIQLIDDKEILLKKCMINELGFSNFYGKNYSPKYMTFKDFVKYELYLKFDLPDLDRSNKPIVFPVEKDNFNYIFKIKGQKTNHIIEDPNLKVFENSRESGIFCLEIFIPMKEVDLASDNFSKYTYENGVFTIIYPIISKSKKEQFVIDF